MCLVFLAQAGRCRAQLPERGGVCVFCGLRCGYWGDAYVYQPQFDGVPLVHLFCLSTATLALVGLCLEDGLTEDVRKELPDMRFVVFAPEVEAGARAVLPVR